MSCRDPGRRRASTATWARHVEVTEPGAFADALREPPDGLRVIEVRTEREEQAALRRELRESVAAALALQELDVPVRPVHADPLPVPDQPGGVLHPHDGR